MRRSPKMNWWIENEKLVGVCLAADYCGEHERGIQGINETLGVLGDATQEWIGLDARAVSIVTSNLSLNKIGTKVYLTLGRYHPLDKEMIKRESELYITKYDKGTDAAAWDDRSFGIIADDKEKRQQLKDLFAAFEAKDIVIYTGRSGPFQNGGLCILIRSQVPEAFALEMAQADRNRIALVTAAGASGIEATLKAAGKTWYALSPKWASELTSTARGDIRTEHPVVFWLNPINQQRYSYGWFTVEELLLWEKDQGPCMKLNEQKDVSL
jgi:hypothetical protein